jgi:hypothetical protein
MSTTVTLHRTLAALPPDIPASDIGMITECLVYELQGHLIEHVGPLQSDAPPDDPNLLHAPRIGSKLQMVCVEPC